MIVSDFTNFLLPDFSDSIQSIFFSIMVILTLGIIISAHIYSGDSKWDKKWTGEAGSSPNENLDIEHGSVMDLSHAVATTPEKLADVMPGLLLIIGLLGTFLGLGLALDNASAILSKPDALSTSAASNSMQDLLNMLQGLGTKFKTSTWGIIAFIFLKTWSEVTRFEEKRLSWVIRKVKIELEARKLQDKSEEESKTVRVVQAISEGSQQTADAISICMTNILDVLTRQENSRIEQQKSRDNILNTLITKHYKLSSEVGETINNSLKNIVGVVIDCNQNADVRASELVSVLNNGFSGTAKGLDSLSFKLEDSSRAISEFSENTQTLISEMSEASSQMAVGASGVGIAAKELVGVIQTFESKFTEVLDQIRTDLGTAINDMSQEAASTLENGSNQLRAATSEISEALGTLSNDIQSTMQQVQGSVKEALEIQRNSANAFIRSSDDLAEKTQNSIDITQKLTTPIELGLRAISESNREQAGVYRKLDASIKELQEMSKTLSAFSNIIVPVESISENLGKSQLELDEIRKAVIGLANSTNYHDEIILVYESMKKIESHAEKQSSLILSALQLQAAQNCSVVESQ